MAAGAEVSHSAPAMVSREETAARCPRRVVVLQLVLLMPGQQPAMEHVVGWKPDGLGSLEASRSQLERELLQVVRLVQFEGTARVLVRALAVPQETVVATAE